MNSATFDERTPGLVREPVAAASAGWGLKKFLVRRGELLAIHFAIALLLLVGVLSAFDWLNVRQNRRAYFAARDVADRVTMLLNAVTDVENSQRGFLLTGDTAFLESYGHAVAASNRDLDLLARAVSARPTRNQVALLGDMIHTEFKAMDATVAMRRRGGPAQNFALAATDNIRWLADRIRAAETSVSDARSASGAARSDRDYLISILSSGVLLIILSFGVRHIRCAAARREQMIAGLEEYADALDQTHTIVQKLDGTILQWTQGAHELYGWTREEALGRNSHELLDASLPQPLEEIRARLLESGSWTGEFQQRCRSGSKLWVVGRWTLHRNAAGEPVSVIKINNDITALKNSEKALRASETAARSFFEHATHGFLTADQQGRIADANAMALGLFGYTRQELIGSSVDMLLPERLRARHIGHRASYALRPHARPMGLGMDLVARRRDGSEFPVEISLSFLTEHHTGGLVIVSITDISARKQLERERENLIGRLESALDEKTVLLKEVHHRVKNNLAVIAGLLGMHADVMGDDRSARALEESQQRVGSMALIHEYLYSTEHLDRVNFGRYIDQLAHELCVSYALEPDLVRVTVDAEDIDLGVHRAIPCGLILNELFSNALKYAFPDGRAGTIEVRFARLDSGDLSLSVKDDGIGIPSAFDWENSHSVGLRVVRILARQIDGRLTLDRTGDGTHFALVFPPAARQPNTQAEGSVVRGKEDSNLESWSEPDGRDPSRSLLRSASASP